MSTEDYLGELRITGNEIKLPSDERQPQAAAPSSNKVSNLPTIGKDTAQRDSALQQKWFAHGKNAKTKGWTRTSPFYENATADYFFFCGFDGVKFEEAQSALKEKLQQALAAHPVIERILQEEVDENTSKVSDFLP